MSDERPRRPMRVTRRQLVDGMGAAAFSGVVAGGAAGFFGGRSVELPVKWMLDDAPHFWFSSGNWDRRIATTSDVREIWEQEFLGLRALGAAAIFTMHPQIIQRPSRLRFLDDFISFVAGHEDVRIDTCAAIADRVP